MNQNLTFVCQGPLIYKSECGRVCGENTRCLDLPEAQTRAGLVGSLGEK